MFWEVVCKNFLVTPPKHGSNIMCLIFLPKVPSHFRKQILKTEGPKILPYKEFDHDNEKRDGENDEFVSPIQSWIDKTCGNRDFP